VCVELLLVDVATSRSLFILQVGHYWVQPTDVHL